MPTTAPHVWRPSAARKITLDAFVPVPRGMAASTSSPLSWPVKDPADLLDYQFDVAPALIGNDGDSIATLDISISPAAAGDLVLQSAAADGTRAVLWLAGGQPGTSYTVTMTIGTQAGRILARSVLLPVGTLAQTAAAMTLQTEAGSTLVDSNGNPIAISA